MFLMLLIPDTKKPASEDGLTVQGCVAVD